MVSASVYMYFMMEMLQKGKSPVVINPDFPKSSEKRPKLDAKF